MKTPFINCDKSFYMAYSFIYEGSLSAICPPCHGDCSCCCCACCSCLCYCDTGRVTRSASASTPASAPKNLFSRDESAILLPGLEVFESTLIPIWHIFPAVSCFDRSNAVRSNNAEILRSSTKYKEENLESHFKSWNTFLWWGLNFYRKNLKQAFQKKIDSKVPIMKGLFTRATSKIVIESSPWLWYFFKKIAAG